MPEPPRPTDGELEILTVLWSRGASTVREVHDAVSARRPAQYTTVLKLMQIMAEKGLVKRNEEQRAHVYEAAQPMEWTQRQLAGDLLQRAFRGSPASLMVGALSARKASKEDLAEMRRLLDEYEGEAMNLIESWIHTPAAAALGQTLLHSLWEGAVVAFVLALVLCFLRSSRARYAAACVAMLSLLGIFAFTFTRTIPQQRVDPNPAAGGAAKAPLPGLDRRVPLGDSNATRTISDYVPWLAPIWMAGVLLFHLRSAATWIAARRIRRTGVCTATAAWQSRVDHLRARLLVSRPVVLLESCLAEVPVVIGHVRPVILMPVGLLAGLPTAQVEAILLHELAHVRRYDYLINLFQLLVESLLFYHPAVWWVSDVIRAERENCCDDLVVAVQGGAFEYARALAALEHNRAGLRQALAATGGNLVKRIRRLLAQPEPRSATLIPVWTALIPIVAVMTAMAWQQPKPADPPPTVAVPSPQLPVKLVAQVQAPPAPARKQGPEPLPQPSADPASPYRKWLNEDVTYIIQDSERQAFRALSADQEREQFIEQFWLRRDPTPGTDTNEMKEEHYRRIAYANERFAAKIPGWKTDRGRIYIQYGPPEEIESHPNGGSYQRPPEQGGGATTTFPFEQWRYKWIEGIGTDVIIEFVDPTMTGEFRMTLDPSEKDALRFGPRPRTINVLGEVRKPGEYVLAVTTTVLRALVDAGGFTGAAHPGTIAIQRGGVRFLFNYEEVIRGVNPSQNIVLLPGDQIIVK